MIRLLPILFFLSLSPAAIAVGMDTTIGITAPKSATGNYKELAHYLCDGLATEQEKANAVYNWITHNIRYDVSSLQKKEFVKDRQAEKAFKHRMAVCEGYSMLFTAMCREAGLKAVNVEGYAKDWIFDNGDNLYIPRHMWSAVMVDGKWWPVEVTWGAGGLYQSPGMVRRVLNKVLRQKIMYSSKLKFRYKYNPSYFMQDPEEFRLKHLPTDPLWQLTDSAMPITLFEAGDSAIKYFNTHYSNPRQSDPELLRIAGLDEAQKVFEFADRAYKYNPRFPVILALKQAYRAAAEVEKAFTDSTVDMGVLLVKDATEGLQKSRDYIKEQKKTFPGEYTLLQKKNTAKNQAATQYIREIKADNKRLMTECKKYVNTSESKGKKVKTKYAANRTRTQGIDPRKVSRQEPAKIQKKENAPELRTLADSIAARNQRLEELRLVLAEKSDTIKARQKENGARLDSLALYLLTGDSILVQEAICRINMKDNYDNEVIALSSLFKQIKYQKADTLQKYYLAGYDTITAMHERRQKLQVLQLDLYKKNLKSMEQYGKWFSSDTTLRHEYIDCVNNYITAINFYNRDLAAYSLYVKGNKKLFGNVAQLTRRQIKLSEYMDKVEKMRKKVEEKTIVENKAWDMKENDRQQRLVSNLIEQLQEISGRANY